MGLWYPHVPELRLVQHSGDYRPITASPPLTPIPRGTDLRRN